MLFDSNVTAKSFGTTDIEIYSKILEKAVE